MKLALFMTILNIAIVTFAYRGYMKGKMVGERASLRELTTTQSQLDHERSMNWLLARRVGEQERKQPP